MIENFSAKTVIHTKIEHITNPAEVDSDDKKRRLNKADGKKSELPSRLRHHHYFSRKWTKGTSRRTLRVRLRFAANSKIGHRTNINTETEPRHKNRWTARAEDRIATLVPSACAAEISLCLGGHWERDFGGCSKCIHCAKCVASGCDED